MKYVAYRIVQLPVTFNDLLGHYNCCKHKCIFTAQCIHALWGLSACPSLSGQHCA